MSAGEFLVARIPAEQASQIDLGWLGAGLEPFAPIVLAPHALQADADGYHYVRDIRHVGIKRKLLVGKPRIPTG